MIGTRLTLTSLNKHLAIISLESKKIEGPKPLHLKVSGEGVPLDTLAETVIDLNNRLFNDKL
jgi:hypothetical protein